MKRKNLLDISNSGLPKSQKEIEAIKKVFLSKDIMHKEALKNNEVLDLDLNQSKIQAEVIIGKSVRVVHDVFGFEEEQWDLEMDFIEIDFYEEFKGAFETTFENYCNKFLKELYRKGIYTLDGLEGYKGVKLNKINDLISVLEKGSDIEMPIRILIQEFYSKLYDFISNFKLENYQVSEKLNFKLNKSQLIWLFQMMYDKKVIAGMSQNDLYRILENHSRYFDADENKYKDMINVRVQANKLINGSSSPKNSIDALNEKFDKDFFASYR